ncbi:TetR family transcriptional regulator [Corynebacterium sp.]|uniref:TetR family transcriptional regulator n=1 Tax=Corynebacterium sp. TaxID=1720 RepID=UPI0026DD9674|nr:TetR/AcrR family transcriptional regulator [Corynebacterium sp.]MDO5031424.1 TetR family transcriptional regulator [Corynebacterium sp.]
MQLSRDAIISAALHLLDSYGLPDVTMRRVASSLNVAPGALYWHVANKQELIAAMAEAVLAPVGGTTPEELALSLRGELLRWRDGAEVAIAGLAHPDLNIGTTLDTACEEAFAAAVPGAPQASVRTASRTLIHSILGATYLAQSRAQLLEGNRESSLAADSPMDGATESPQDGAAELHRTIDLLIAGLTAQASR